MARQILVKDGVPDPQTIRPEQDTNVGTRTGVRWATLLDGADIDDQSTLPRRYTKLSPRSLVVTEGGDVKAHQTRTDMTAGEVDAVKEGRLSEAEQMALVNAFVIIENRLRAIERVAGIDTPAGDVTPQQIRQFFKNQMD